MAESKIGRVKMSDKIPRGHIKMSHEFPAKELKQYYYY